MRPYSVDLGMSTLSALAGDCSRVSTLESLELLRVYRYVGELETRIHQRGRGHFPWWDVLGRLIAWRERWSDRNPSGIVITRRDLTPELAVSRLKRAMESTHPARVRWIGGAIGPQTGDKTVVPSTNEWIRGFITGYNATRAKLGLAPLDV